MKPVASTALAVIGAWWRRVEVADDDAGTLLDPTEKASVDASSKNVVAKVAMILIFQCV